MSLGVGVLKYLPENLQEFLPTYLVSLEGERWLVEEKNLTKSHQQKAAYMSVKGKIHRLQSQWPHGLFKQGVISICHSVLEHVWFSSLRIKSHKIFLKDSYIATESIFVICLSLLEV